MARDEKVILTNMCMVRDKDGRVLVQNRRDPDFPGIIFPGGHLEKGESVRDSVIREVFEETGITVKNPALCGIKEFYTKDGARYVVFLYRADEFKGEIRSSDEGEAFWVERERLFDYKTVSSLDWMVQVFEGSEPKELWYHDGYHEII